MSGGEFKGWVPTAYLDEVSPAPRETPEDWLFHGDVLRLAPAEADEGEPPGEPVVDGLLVSFHGLTDLDPIEVTWRGPGDHTIHGDVPPEATHFWLPFDPDTMAETIEAFLAQNGRDGVFEPGERFDVFCYAWAETTFVYRTNRFEAVVTAARALS